MKASTKKPTTTRKPTKADTPTSSLVKVPASLEDIRMTKSGKTTVATFISAELVKIGKNAEGILRAYCEIGRALVIAKAAVIEAGGKWGAFCEKGTMGISSSATARYMKAAEYGVDKLLAQMKSDGMEKLNFKALLDSTKASDVAAGAAKAHGNAKPLKGRTEAPKPPQTTVRDMPLTITDSFIDQLVDVDVPVMSLSQVTRLLLAVQDRKEELESEAKVIEAA